MFELGWIGAVLYPLLVPLYFLPMIAASRRKHHRRGAILALNLFLGWTVLGWIGALVWAYTSTQPAPSTPVASAARYCTHCRSAATGDARFCPRCGTATGTVKTG